MGKSLETLRTYLKEKHEEDVRNHPGKTTGIVKRASDMISGTWDLIKKYPKTAAFGAGLLADAIVPGGGYVTPHLTSAATYVGSSALPYAKGALAATGLNQGIEYFTNMFS